VNQEDIPTEIIGADRRRIEALRYLGPEMVRAAVNTWYHSRGRKSPRELAPEPDQDELERRHP
jgi:hypothetical protein